MAEYMLLIKQGDYTKRSPEEMQQIVQRYIDWVKKLREQGKYKAGDELQSSGRVLRKQNGKFTDGPFTETKESIGGYLLIDADSYEQAVEFSKGCPTFDHGGSVEIRAISLYN